MRDPAALALGVLCPEPGTGHTDLTELRVALALLGARHGYTALEVFTTAGEPSAVADTLAVAEPYVVRFDVDALLVHGNLDDALVEEFAARLRLVSSACRHRSASGTRPASSRDQPVSVARPLPRDQPQHTDRLPATDRPPTPTREDVADQETLRPDVTSRPLSPPEHPHSDRAPDGFPGEAR
jgi:hypothetical protein